MAQFYRLTIEEIHRVTPQSVALSFTIPDALKGTFTFIPGQYITLQKEMDGTLVRRDYSICSAISASNITVGIKAVEKGLFSQFANTQLKAGDVLEVSAPTGRFNLAASPDQKKNYVAFAAGSGITPILSMISSSLEVEPESRFVLVFGNKRQDDVMFYKELQQLQERFEGRFFIHYLFSQEQQEGAMSGRITANTVRYILTEQYADLDFDAYFLCGPEPMINEVKDTLHTQGIAPNSVHFELFTSSATTDSDQEEFDGESEVHIILDDEEESFTMRGDQSILEAALLEGLDAPYSCQGGICSTCIAQVTEGKAQMKKNSILTEQEVEDGLILTCQAHPITAKISIDYDAV